MLLPLGLFAFFQHLGISLFEGSEGLYAHITREMVDWGEYVHLTYQGEPYINKSPFFFWTLALSTGLFGDNEIALRLPGSLFSVGTMALTYALGTMLFSSSAAFWAALVVATTHLFLWYGRRVLFDSMLTFWMTLALLSWARVHFHKASPAWWWVSFTAMALATMTKGLHGLVLPLLNIVLFLVAARQTQSLKSRAFWGGQLWALVLIGAYMWLADLRSEGHALVAKGPIVSFATTSPSGNPPYWYLGVMWFDFFPWSALIPAAVVWLVSRWRTGSEAEKFVLLWFLGYLVLMSLSPIKREPYLMPMVPALGLMVGYCCQQISGVRDIHRPQMLIFWVMLGCVGLSYIIAVTVGPDWLHRKWNLSLSLFPPLFTVILITLSLMLIYGAVRRHVVLALTTLAISSIVFMVGVIQIILPAIDHANSARDASHAIKAWARQSRIPVQLYAPGWPRNEDLVYYLTTDPALPRIASEQSLVEAVRVDGTVLFLADPGTVTKLNERGDLKLDVIQEFPQRRNKGLSLLLGTHSRPSR